MKYLTTLLEKIKGIFCRKSVPQWPEYVPLQSVQEARIKLSELLAGELEYPVSQKT